MADWRFIEILRERVGEEIFVSDWLEVTQPDLDTFAEVTDDWDYMHNDPAWAANGPWGTTIAHGFFLLSLLSRWHREAGFPAVATDDEHLVNYGLDRVRFTEPVRVGDLVRARCRLLGIETRKPGRDLIRTQITCETERLADRPHMIAEALTLYVYGEAVADSR